MGYIDLRAFMLQEAGLDIPITQIHFSKLTKAERNMWRAASNHSRQDILLTSLL